MRSLAIALIILLGALSTLSLYTVSEPERGLVFRLGQIQIDSDTKEEQIKAPGLHMKVPFIDKIIRFDTRIHTLDIRSSEITTMAKKNVLVDLYIQWRIENLPLYYKRTSKGQRSFAESLLEQKVISSLKAEFGQLSIKEVVSGERIELMQRIRKITDQSTEHLGIKVLDVRLKRIDFPQAVSQSVSQRMRAERARVANELRAEGVQEATIIRADANRERRVILATAEKESKEIRGRGDAKAIEIYAEAYNQSPEFFDFYRSLEAYKNAFQDKGDILVLNPSNETFFKYFKQDKLK